MSSALSPQRRTADIEALASGTEVDVLVVGGGITGVGVALDAATRGLSVALLEKEDLASGTSRWSSKLAHGGLRYLAHGDLAVAWESAVERAILIDRTAPHLVRALPMAFPLNEAVSSKKAAEIQIGFRLGDALRRASGTRASRLARTRRISAGEAKRWLPALSAAGLRGAVMNWEGQLEDDARLVVGIARTAAAHGARIVTHARVTQVTGEGATAVDAITGQEFAVRARHVVNACGVWSGDLASDLRLRPSKGSHLVIGAARLGDPAAAMTVPVPGESGRYVFALPRPDGLVVVGLTDEPFDGPIPDVPEVTPQEEAFLLETISEALAEPLTSDDVVGRYAGLRPLLDDGNGATADVSRKHAVIEDPGSGMLTIVGGKLTTYRRMAQDVVDVLAGRPGVAAGPCRTKRLAIVGAVGVAAQAPPALVRRYGSEAGDVLALAEGRAEMLEPLAPGVPVIGAEVRWAVEREGAVTLDDVLHRRTRVGLVPALLDAAREPAARLLADLPTTEEIRAA